MELCRYYTTILVDATDDSRRLRAAFGFPEQAGQSIALYKLLSSHGQSSSRLLGEAAQRVDQCLWRFEFSLEYVQEQWAADLNTRSKALRTILAPTLIAAQPTSQKVLSGLEVSDLTDVAESAPDPSVYAVLRSFRHSHDDVLDGEAKAEDVQKALDYLFGRLEKSVKQGTLFQDSSNAWWAMRTGICHGDQRFRELLPQFLKTYRDPIVPSQEVVKRAYIPEIYGVLRTTSYTLSNAQAILVCAPGLAGEVRAGLVRLIEDMARKLVDTPINEQVYLASVHHEGLRNYLDFVASPPKPLEGDVAAPRVDPEPAGTGSSRKANLPAAAPNNNEGKDPSNVDDKAKIFSVFSKFGIGGLGLGVAYVLLESLIGRQIFTPGQVNLLLLLLFGLATMSLMVGLAQQKTNRWLPLLLAVFSVAMSWLALGMPGWSRTDPAYNIRGDRAESVRHARRWRPCVVLPRRRSEASERRLRKS